MDHLSGNPVVSWDNDAVKDEGESISDQLASESKLSDGLPKKEKKRLTALERTELKEQVFSIMKSVTGSKLSQVQVRRAVEKLRGLPERGIDSRHLIIKQLMEEYSAANSGATSGEVIESCLSNDDPILPALPFSVSSAVPTLIKQKTQPKSSVVVVAALPNEKNEPTTMSASDEEVEITVTKQKKKKRVDSSELEDPLSASSETIAVPTKKKQKGRVDSSTSSLDTDSVISTTSALPTPAKKSKSKLEAASTASTKLSSTKPKLTESKAGSALKKKLAKKTLPCTDDLLSSGLASSDVDSTAPAKKKPKQKVVESLPSLAVSQIGDPPEAATKSKKKTVKGSLSTLVLEHTRPVSEVAEDSGALDSRGDAGMEKKKVTSKKKEQAALPTVLESSTPNEILSKEKPAKKTKPKTKESSEPPSGKKPVTKKAQSRVNSETVASSIPATLTALTSTVGFNNTNFNKVYKNSSSPNLSCLLLTMIHEVAHFFGETRAVGLKANKSDCDNFVKALQKEQLDEDKKRDDFLTEVPRVAQRLWSSSEKLRLPNGRDVEFCSMINCLLREDNIAIMPQLASICQSINELITKKQRKSGVASLPASNLLYRGGSLPDELQGFFSVGKKYRVPGYLATTSNIEATYPFLQLVDEPLAPVQWIIHLDPKFGCLHVAFVELSNFPGEFEYLFGPFSVFTVRKVEWKECPTWMNPHVIELEAAPCNRAEGRVETNTGKILPFAPWS